MSFRRVLVGIDKLDQYGAAPLAPWVRPALLTAPFIIGAMACGLTYSVLAGIEEQDEREHDADVDSHVEASPRSESRASNGPLRVLGVIVAASATICAFFGGALTFAGDDHSQFFLNILFGGGFGAALGLVLAIPAALIIAVVQRRRA
jgi:hypothetical protein